MASPFDRAWSRRPMVSPARWMPMASVPDLWAETLVTFSRSRPVPTPGGGYDRGLSGIYLVTYCHAEIAEQSAPAAQSGGETLVVAQWWRIFLPVVVDDIPLDPANYPHRGDRMRFTDDLGATVDIAIRSVTSPETMADHWEIESETFS